jgi:hypothetical protein
MSVLATPAGCRVVNVCVRVVYYCRMARLHALLDGNVCSCSCATFWHLWFQLSSNPGGLLHDVRLEELLDAGPAAVLLACLSTPSAHPLHMPQVRLPIPTCLSVGHYEILSVRNMLSTCIYRSTRHLN